MSFAILAKMRHLHALAYFLLETSLNAVRGPENIDVKRVTLDVDADSWKGLLEAVFGMRPVPGPWQKAMTEWLCGICLLAAPESGLSVATAAAILRGNS